MYRRGIVSAVDVDTHRARVTFPEHDGVESGWLDVLVRDTLDDREQSLPSAGAQVAVMLDEREESGCVLGALYSSEDAPPAPQSTDVRRWTMKDGARFEYDRAEHLLTIEIPNGDVEVKVGGLVKVASASDFVALAQKVDDAIAALVQAYNAHVHPTGVGPSAPPATVLASQSSVACTKVKVD